MLKTGLTVINSKFNKNVFYNVLKVRFIFVNQNENNRILCNATSVPASIVDLRDKTFHFNNQKNCPINLKGSKRFSTNSIDLNKELSKILTKAEKLVGYGTSFFNLRYLVSDEIANFANLLRKLMQTKHPLIKIAKSLVSTNELSDYKRSLQINGLIILLISKAAGTPKNDLLRSDISDGIHISQRRLAEITQMIYMASLIHKGILDLKQVNSSEYKDMDQGNKLAVLCGDYLLANACTNLSKLKNAKVVALMSEVIADFSEGIFKNNNSKSHTSFLKQWYDNVYSNTSSILANSAKAALLLVMHSPKLQEVAWTFAKNFDITHKIWSDLLEYKNDNSFLNKPDTILNAIYKDKYINEENEEIGVDEKKLLIAMNDRSSKVSYLKLKSSQILSSIYETTVATKTPLEPVTKTILSTNQAINNYVFNDCKDLLNNHYELAMKSLTQLENEHSEIEALSSLKSILNVMKNTI